jgi:peptide-methionine (S)-S-oxide reductase
VEEKGRPEGARLAPGSIPDMAVPADAAVAIFATGCFWCTEADFEKVPGVYEAVSGYIGGSVPHPT